MSIKFHVLVENYIEEVRQGTSDIQITLRFLTLKMHIIEFINAVFIFKTYKWCLHNNGHNIAIEIKN